MAPQGACLVFDINEIAASVTSLPPELQKRWAAFDNLPSKQQRASVLRKGRQRMYHVALHGDQSPVRRRRQAQLADMRAKAAAAAASLAADTQDDNGNDATATLAARLLAHMEAASQRRAEAQQARRTRLASKHDLLLARLGRPQASGSASCHRDFLSELQARVAGADASAQHGDSQHPACPDAMLEQLVARHSSADWLQGLSPCARAMVASFCITRSSKRLQRSWRSFTAQHKSTVQLAQAFADQGVLGGQQQPAAGAGEEGQAAAGAEAQDAEAPVPGMVMVGGMAGSDAAASKHACFEEFAAKLQSPVTIRAAQALLARLEKRLAVRGVSSDAAESLLRALSPSAPASRQLERYPVRVMLCAYMIKEHPEVVFSRVGDIEARLSAAAQQMLVAFEALLAQLLQQQPAAATPATNSGSGNSLADDLPHAALCRACPSPLAGSMTAYLSSARAPAGAGVSRQLFPAASAFGGPGSPAGSGVPLSRAASPLPAASPASIISSSSGSPAGISRAASLLLQQQPGQQQSSLGALLVAFDDSWLEYLDQFVVWKGRDAASLAQELMRMAVKLERSMRLKLGRREVNSPEVRANPDLQAMVSQVSHDHALLAERILRLTGAQGSVRLEAALAHVRQQVLAELQAAEEAAEAAAEASSEVSADGRPRAAISRPGSRTGSLIDPVSDAEALAAAHAAAQPEQDASQPTSPTAGGDGVQQEDALSNEQMVWEMLYNPAYCLPTAEAEAAWHRAMGKPDTQDEEVDASDAESMTPQQLAALVARRARRIAEQAFWDSIVWRFKTAAQGHALPGQLAPLLAELGTELSGFVAEPAEAQQLGEAYAEAAVLARLTSSSGQQGGGANLTALGGMMEQLAQALLTHGGAARAAEGADAAAALRARMTAALAAAAAERGASSPSPVGGDAAGSPQQAQRREEATAAAALAEALAAALRLLMTQLKVVKLDAANARLAGLARAMREQQHAVAYLQTKLGAAWQLPQLQHHASAAELQQAAVQLADTLPRTAAWVGQVRAGLQQQLTASLSNAGLLLDPAAAAAAVVAGGLASVELRSGVRASPSASPGRSPQLPRSPVSSSASPSASPAPWALGPAGSPSAATAVAAAAATAVKPRFPVGLESTQGVVRAGLLALVTGDSPAVGPHLPEVLRFDRARLHELQNDLQQLMVAAAGLLIVQQLRQAAGLPWDAELRAGARRRLLVVLSDPGMKLAHLVTELAQLAGAGSVATEERVKHMFTTIVNPEAAAFRSINAGITAALAAQLLYGRAAMAADGAASAACASLLGRVGAVALSEDVADLGQRLAAVAGVCEAVHGSTLALLATATTPASATV